MRQKNIKYSSSRIKYSSPIKYKGNIFILILFALIWFPIALVLLIKNCQWSNRQALFYVDYHGRLFWLYFWAIVFFPVIFILLFIKGVDIIEEKEHHPQSVSDDVSGPVERF